MLHSFFNIDGGSAMAKNDPTTTVKQARSLDQASFSKAMADFLRPSSPRRKAGVSQKPTKTTATKTAKK
jgi:hypothetical protein